MSGTNVSASNLVATRIDTSVVPLPASAFLMLSGLADAALILRRRQRAQQAASA